jgi:uncharacterized protein (DUF169 family)
MESRIASAIHLKTEPVALIWSDEKPQKALEFAPGRFGCVMHLLAAAAKGKTAVASRETFGCPGGGVGLGFGNRYLDFAGGVDGFCKFLSSGNKDTEMGRQIGEAMAASGGRDASDDFLEGERYLKTPEHTQRYLTRLPMRDIPAKYVVFKPLKDVKNGDDVRTITFFTTPDQLSALVVLASYDAERPDDAATVPFGAGCQSAGVWAYAEAEKENPRAVIGLIDLSARNNIRQQLGRDVMSFTVSPKLFARMEGNVDGSFLQRNTWRELTEKQ